MTIFIFLSILSAGSLFGQCLAVDGEWVTARDISQKIGRYAATDPEMHLLRTPFPGARRLVNPSNLPKPERRDFAEVIVEEDQPEDAMPFCVERRMRIIPRETYDEAIRRSLTSSGKESALEDADSGIHYELVDYDHSPLPSGRLEFLIQTLPPPVTGNGLRVEDPVLWRGKLWYAEGRSMPTWARVRMWVEANVCVLSRGVARGAELKPSDCVVALKKYPPFLASPLADPQALKHASATRALRAGEAVFPFLLVRTADVEPDRPVDLRVVSGATRLRFQGKAAAPAHTGERVAVTVPSTGKRIEGQVVGTDSVEVHLK